MTAWRVTPEGDGAMLDLAIGTTSDAAGRVVVQTTTRVCHRGEVLRDLAPELAQRWEAGDPHLRAVIEPVDLFDTDTDGEA